MSPVPSRSGALDRRGLRCAIAGPHGAFGSLTTEAGERLLQGARHLVADAAELESGVRLDAARLAGTIRMSAPVDLGHARIAPLRDDFMAEHDGIRVDLHLIGGRSDLAGQGLDLAVRYGTLADSSWCVAGHALAMKSGHDIEEDVRAGWLVLCLDDYCGTSSTLQVAYPSSSRVRVRVRALVERLVAAFGGDEAWRRAGREPARYRNASFAGVEVIPLQS